tara:strand:- start:7772 stop:8056 length:285 start_codon:yes stop_codon:yes gene_type:complete
VAKDFDPMAQTNAEFYDIINQEDWDLDSLLEEDVFEMPMDDFIPMVFEYQMPGPIPGVMVRIMCAMRDEDQRVDFLQFLNNFKEFLNEEDENYG